MRDDLAEYFPNVALVPAIEDLPCMEEAIEWAEEEQYRDISHGIFDSSPVITNSL